MNNLQIRRDLAASFVVGIPGKNASPEDLALISRERLGGIILFARNVDQDEPERVWDITSALQKEAADSGQPPLFIMLDQEGGSVARLKGRFTHGPDLSELGSRPPGELFNHARRMGEELCAAGFNWNLAPVLDVHATDGGVMSRRSLGGDPEKVAELGLAFLKGLESTGVLGCVKHFPGLGRTNQDTHWERPVLDLSLDELEAVELIPFARAIEQGAGQVMVCHAVYPALDPDCPASLSYKVINGFLRDSMGFNGLVLSDDLEMGALAGDLTPDQAAVRAYMAGADLMLICHRPELALSALDQLCALVEEGELSADLVRKKAARLMKVRDGLPAMKGREELLALLKQRSDSA